MECGWYRSRAFREAMKARKAGFKDVWSWQLEEEEKEGKS